jgi:hypothetical protein
MNTTVAGGPHAALTAHGLRVVLPARWEGRLYRREVVAGGAADEAHHPVLHLANFALPPGRGDFGTGAVEVMGEGHAFVSLLDYGPEQAGTALFAATGRPRLTAADFAPNALQRRLPGQLGCQRFFTENGRAFCLYVVLGSRRRAKAQLAAVEQVLTNVEVGAITTCLSPRSW